MDILLTISLIVEGISEITIRRREDSQNKTLLSYRTHTNNERQSVLALPTNLIFYGYSYPNRK